MTEEVWLDFACRGRVTDVEGRLVVAGSGGHAQGSVWQIGRLDLHMHSTTCKSRWWIEICCVAWGALLYNDLSTMGEESKVEWTLGVYVADLFTIRQKLTQHCRWTIFQKNNQRKEVWLIQWRKKSSMLEPGIADLFDLNSVPFQTAYWLRLGHTNEYHFLLIWKWVVRTSAIVLFHP